MAKFCLNEHYLKIASFDEYSYWVQDEILVAKQLNKKQEL